MRETEWKYEAPSGADVPDLAGLPHVAVQSDGGRQTLAAVYYDTDELLLSRSGITLRRRTGGDDAGWHLKLPDRPGTRTEIRMPLGDELPAELTALVTARLRGRPLKPVARITTSRHRRILADDSGRPLAEVVADEVITERLGEPPAADHWNEVEVELTGGDVQLLEAADARLRERGLTRSGRASKLERALGEKLTTGPGQAGAREKSAPTAADVVCDYIRLQRDELLDRDPRVRLDEPEAVHDMRVAARRLRSALQAFGRVLRREETGEIVEELRWLGRALGQARDREVVAERLEAGLAGLAPELVIGPVAQRIARYGTQLTAADAADSVRTLDSGRYLALLDALDRLVETPPLAPGADRRAAEVVPKYAGRAFRRVGKRAEHAFAAEPGEQRDLALHATRKAAKRARYAAEVARLATGKKAVARTIGDLKDLQTALGDHQDTVLTRPAVLRMGLEAYAAQENSFTYGLLHGREAESAAACRESAREILRKAGRPKRTKWMK